MRRSKFVGFFGANAAIAAAMAVPPTIHVSWSETPAPVANVDFLISTDSPASPDFPDVELRTGSLTWRIWS